MNETKFTKGPWKYQEDADAYTHIVRGPNNRFITHLGQDLSGRDEADARLISAAPELYEALEALLDISDFATNSKVGEIHLRAMAALAKARGEVTA